MIAAKRTSRDSVIFILPVIAIFSVVMTYVSFAAYGLVPVAETISTDATWIAPPIAVLLWFALLKYVYGVIYPVTYLTEIFPDRIVFSDSSNPANPTVFERADVVRFYVEPKRWWHNPDAFYPVLCETRTGQTVKISWNFVYDNTSPSFFQAVREVWGNEYAPTTQVDTGR